MIVDQQINNHSVKVLSIIVCYSLVAMVPDLCQYLAYDSRGALHALNPMLLQTYKPEIHAIEKSDFLRPIIHSQIF